MRNATWAVCGTLVIGCASVVVGCNDDDDNGSTSSGGMTGSGGGTAGSGGPNGSGGANGGNMAGAAGSGTVGMAGSASGGVGAGGAPPLGGAAGASNGGATGGIETTLSYLDVREQVRRVNDYWITGHEDPGSNTWDRATYFSANMMAYATFNELDYRTYSESWAESHAWGLNGGVATRFADNHCAGQVYLDLYDLDPAANKIAAIQTSIEAMVDSTKRDDWWWIDALHMAMPVFAQLGEQTGESKYAEAMFEFYLDTRDTRSLYNTIDALWYRDGGYMPPNLTPGGQDIYWSRGNGWVFAAMAKTLTELSANAPHRSEYAVMLRSMAAALARVQRPDGFFNPSLHDPDHYGGPESSGTGFFTYGMAWGINNGLLDPDTYVPVVERAWAALSEQAQHPDGFLGYCQAIGAEPGPAPYDNTTDYCVGAFIMAGCEISKMLSAESPEVALDVLVDSVTAEQEGNEAIQAVDGSILTRWSASGYPQTIVLDLESDVSVGAIELHAFQNRAYQYTVETMPEGGDYQLVVDHSDNTLGGKLRDELDESPVRYVRVTLTGASGYDGEWISISDIRLFGGG